MQIIDLPPLRFIGQDIYQACKNAVETAEQEDAIILFMFNDIQVKALPGSNPELLVKTYADQVEARHRT